ncbi:MAG: HD-GYP domain-containing protein [Synergistaceae bacterium]|nr:HD-GYP domain-containing protein [Synergistota bacterium]NLM72185.1 HD-GYP domain-containing protein [Synergistaceae bacterium]
MRVLKNVPISDLHMYRGHVVEDVVSPSGSLLLPSGGDIRELLHSMPSAVKNLSQWGIETVLLSVSYNISEEDFKIILENVRPKIRVLEAEVAHKTIAQVDEVYTRITENGTLGEGAYHLAQQAAILSEEVSRTPQILLCLSKVKDSDEYTFVHSLNVALLSGFLARKLEPDDGELAAVVTYGGLLHDLGKARVPQGVLNKPGKLTSEEYEIMKQHSALGYEVARNSGISDTRVLSVIRSHHERWNGRGYPDGLKSRDIPLFARLTAVADVFDALTAKRVYKEPSTSREAVSLMLKSSEGDFDWDIVRLLLVSVGLYPPGTIVELSDYSTGVVIASQSTDLMRPTIHVFADREGKRVPPEGRLIDLSAQTELYVRRTLDDLGKGTSYL